MSWLTRDAEKHELPRCAACDRPLGAEPLVGRDGAGAPVSFCDEKCREDYYLDLNVPENEPGDLGGEAA